MDITDEEDEEDYDKRLVGTILFNILNNLYLKPFLESLELPFDDYNFAISSLLKTDKEYAYLFEYFLTIKDFHNHYMELYLYLPETLHSEVDQYKEYFHTKPINKPTSRLQPYLIHKSKVILNKKVLLAVK